MVDCGADWLKSFRKLSPTAIVLTHGHSDHAFGLAEGAPCPWWESVEDRAVGDDPRLVTTVVDRHVAAAGDVRPEPDVPADQTWEEEATIQRVSDWPWRTIG